MENRYAKGLLFTTVLTLTFALTASGIYDCRKALCACQSANLPVVVRVQKPHVLNNLVWFSSMAEVREDLSQAD